MTWVDLAVLAFVLISGLLAFGRGLVREILGIGAWAGAVAAAISLMPSLHDTVANYVHARQWVDPVSFLVVFLIALAILMVIAHMAGRVVRSSMLGGLDRTLGLVFGLVRGAALITVAYIIGGMLAPIDRWPPPVLQARSLTPTYEAAAWVRSQLPESFRPARLEPPPRGRDTTAEALFHAMPQGRPAGKPSDHE
jgi:membrane protein required for colicin V production